MILINLKKKFTDSPIQSNNLYLQLLHKKLYIYEERFANFEAPDNFLLIS
jgi:hypothetical protein